MESGLGYQHSVCLNLGFVEMLKYSKNPHLDLPRISTSEVLSILEENGSKTEVGHGACAVLYLCMLLSNQAEVVVKYFYDHIDMSDVYHEAEMTWGLSTNDVTPKFYGILEHFGKDLPAMVMSYEIGAALNFSKPHRDCWCQPALKIAKSLSKLHLGGYIHGDLKPENIIFNQDFVKPDVTLIDLGQSSSSAESYKYDLSNSARVFIQQNYDYIAPELLNGEEFSTYSDVFALGALYKKMGDKFAHVAHLCLNPDPKQRPDVGEVIRVLEELCIE